MFDTDTAVLVDDASIGEWVPESLDTMEPGHLMANLLSSINVGDCTPYDRVRVLRAQQRMVAHYTAHLYQSMNSVVDMFRDDLDETEYAETAAAAEVAAALRLTRRASDIEMGFALELGQRLPVVFDALFSGTIDVRRARAIVDGTLHLNLGTARQVADTIIADAGLLTTGQLRAKLRKLCIDTDPDDAKDRFKHGHADRRIVTEANDDGTATLSVINTSPDRLAAALGRVNHIAKQLTGPGEPRTKDQLRNDILIDLLIGSEPPTRAGRGTLDLHTDLPTLTKLANHPGDLAGYGPVIGDIARQVAERQHDSEWRWTLDDPETGRPIAHGTTRRRPTAQQRREVETRDRTCIHPGCRMPATHCDIDHRITWAECNQTCTDNLAALCRYHHIIRHKAGWTYKPTTDGGDYAFTTPTGHTYTTTGRSP